MDLIKIKAMYDYSNKVEKDYKDMFNENREERTNMLNQSIEKINKYFDDLLDAIEGTSIWTTYKGKKIKLYNNKNARFAMVELGTSEVLVSKRNSGLYARYSKDEHPEKAFYDHLWVGSEFYYKSAFVDFFLKNKEEIEEVIYQEIKSEIDKKIKENSTRIQVEAAFLERMKNYNEEI